MNLGNVRWYSTGVNVNVNVNVNYPKNKSRMFYTMMLADLFTQSTSILLSNIEFMLGIGTFL